MHSVVGAGLALVSRSHHQVNHSVFQLKITLQGRWKQVSKEQGKTLVKESLGQSAGQLQHPPVQPHSADFQRD
jgi:hypothetical protein